MSFSVYITFILFYNTIKIVTSGSSATRIFGGTTADQGDFPSLALLLLDNKVSGSCTIVTVNHVLTTAHSLFIDGKFAERSRIKVIAGDIFIPPMDAGPHRTLRTASLIFICPKFHVRNTWNDIAVIRVKTPFPITPNAILPIEVSELHVPKTGQECWIAGWGSQKYESIEPELVQRKVTISILPWSKCWAGYRDSILSGSNFCAGAKEGGKDSCIGDSGGGLYCDKKLVGLISFGIGCGLPRHPGVYVNVSVYVPWIKNCFAYNGEQTDIPNPDIPGDRGFAVKLMISKGSFCLSMLIFSLTMRFTLN